MSAARPPQVVDVHNHAIPAGFVARVRAEGARYGFSLHMPADVDPVAAPADSYGERVGDELLTTSEGQVADLRPRRTDEAKRAREMAEAGIDLYLESITPKVMNYGANEEQAEWGARAINDGFAENMRAFPDRVLGTAHVPLQFPAAAVKELERAVGLGMRSVQIATNVRGRNLDDPSLDPFWAAAEGLAVLVIPHPQYDAARDRLLRYHLRNLIGNPLEDTIACANVVFGGVIERFPRLRICFVHAGGYAPWIRGRWRHGYRVRPEASERMRRTFEESFGAVYFDTLIHDEAALRFLIATVGADRLLFGSDYAADMGSWHEQLRMIRALADVSDADKIKILGGNAIRLIGGG